MEIIYENCCVCMEDKYLITTECNHNFCICCLIRVNKCPMCRKKFKKISICSEIKNYHYKLEQKKLNNIIKLFDVLPNFIAHNFIAQSTHTNDIIVVEYIYLDVNERRNFAQQGHEYLIEQLSG